MPVIDTHCHTTPTALVRELQRVAEGTGPEAPTVRRYLDRADYFGDPQMVGALDERVELLEGAGIDTQIISSTVPLGVLFADLGQRVAMGQLANDDLSAACQRHPERYRFFANLPLPDVRASVDELQRAARLPGFSGVVVLTSFGLPYHDRQLDDFYRALVEARAPLFIHPTRMETPGRFAQLGMETMIGWPGQDTLAVMELIFGGVLDRVPELTVIAPHLSGTALYLAGRIERRYDDTPAAERGSRESPMYYLKRMYHDSVIFVRPPLDLARSIVGADRIVLGSDYPHCYRDDIGGCVELIDGLDWPEEERALVRGGNMERVLRECGRW
jgi:aminocarboxymuconate-semialdehyde decarboxylase